jgi:hypothetical protein
VAEPEYEAMHWYGGQQVSGLTLHAAFMGRQHVPWMQEVVGAEHWWHDCAPVPHWYGDSEP